MIELGRGVDAKQHIGPPYAFVLAPTLGRLRNLYCESGVPAVGGWGWWLDWGLHYSSCGGRLICLDIVKVFGHCIQIKTCCGDCLDTVLG